MAFNQQKTILMERKQEITNHLQDNYGLHEELIKESMGELSNYDNHPADHGSELYEREKDVALNEHAEKELSDINHALKAMEKGTYGACEVCGKSIPTERLEAMPTTLRCIDHSEQHVAVNRPVEEDVFSSNLNEVETEIDEEESTVFDTEDAWQHVEVYGSSDGPSDFYDTEKDYQDMYYNSGELVGSPEEIEGFLLTDMEGNYIGVNGNHEDYEAYLDENEVGSILYD